MDYLKLSFSRLAHNLIFAGLLVATCWSHPVTACLQESKQAEALPNIVLILSDDQAWTDYGFMDHPSIKTANLDRLAKQSVLFRRGYVPTSLCRPSLATLITGRYASTHGITGNDPSTKRVKAGTEAYKQQRLKLIQKLDQFETLPKLLATKGYLSHQSGKWWEGSYSNGGFTHGMTLGYPKPGGRHGDKGLAIGREGMQAVTQFIDHAVESKKPFFVWYAPFLPHTPHNPPPRLLKKYSVDGQPKTVSKYFAMCEWFDETCGQLLGHLEKRELTENTIVVYVTDNGWIQNPDKRGYAPKSKQTPYEAGVRTPIMFRWPGKFAPADRKELVSSIDLMPTLLSAAGIERKPLPGLNLLPSLRDGKPLERDTIFGEGFAHDIANLDSPEDSLLYRWCIEGDWKLILTYDGEVNRYQTTHPRNEKRPQLFRLNDDPHERTNVAGKHPDVVKRLVKKLNKWYPVKQRKTLVEFQP